MTINYTTADGTATGNADYTPVTGTITFAPNQTTQTISVPIIGDTVKEINEQFTLKLSIPTAKDSKGNDISTEPALELAGTGIGTGTIVDDDSFVGISIGDVTITQGDSGQKTATFTVKLSGPTASAITLNYTTIDGGCSRGDQCRPKNADYQATSGTLTFDPAQNQIVQTISVPIFGDLGAEPDETFTVRLSGASTFSGPPTGTKFMDAGDTQPLTLSATGTIHNDHTQIGLSVNDLTVSEGAGSARFSINLSEASTTPITVNFQTLDDTQGSNPATSAGLHPDYIATHGTITIPAGVTQYTVDLPNNPITIIDDSLKESPETFQVQIFKATGAIITHDTGTVTITDNDANGLVGFSINGQAQAPEGNSAGSSQVTFTVNLTAAATSDVTFLATPRELVGFGSQGAKAGVDFVATPVSVTIPAGDTSATFSIPILGNTTFQDDRSFAVDVSKLSSNAQAQNSTAIGTILDDDTSFVHNVLKWHDVDGDVVTLKISKGNLANAGFNFSTPNTNFGGITLEELNISGGKHQFAHANVTITADPVKLLATSQVIGDGHVNVGAIIANDQPLNPLQTANAVDLGVVTVDGDLARIDAGDFFSDTALTRLNVADPPFGAHPETLPSGQTPVSTIVGPLGGVHIATNFGGVADNAPTGFR